MGAKVIILFQITGYFNNILFQITGYFNNILFQITGYFNNREKNLSYSSEKHKTMPLF